MGILNCGSGLTNPWTIRALEKVKRLAGITLNPYGLVRTLNSNLTLDSDAFFYMVTEGIEWDWIYIPEGGLNGKTVLDLGACCGETAWLFFRHGAKKVICIEPNPNRWSLISYNGWKNGWNIENYNRKFQFSDLDIPRDFTKANIEGYEALFLQRPDKLGPMVLDVHDWYLVEKFKEIGFHCITQPSQSIGQCYMRNF